MTNATGEVLETTVGAEPGFTPHAVLTGASALIAATGVERGFGFLANLLAARIGGVSTFGGYSLAMTTANNIAAYAGAGIGSTATRFVGEHPPGTPGARAVARALVLVSSVSALIAGLVLFAGAGPLARVLLNQPGLSFLLRWASLSACVMILFECCRGFLIGQRQPRSLLLFSGVMGAGMVVALPLMSRLGAVPMVCAQASVATAAIASVLVLRGKRTHAVPASAAVESTARMARRVWNFGLVQLLGIAGLNAAGWWITSVVTRTDPSLAEMGMFAVANQVRNVVALIPGLLTQSSFALLADEEAFPSRVLLFCTYLASLAVLLLAGIGVVLLPFALPLIWGKSFAGGVLAASLALVTAVVHMSGSAAAARLTILSLPITGLINGVWSVSVVALSIVFFGHFHRGASAALAMGIYLCTHLISASLVLIALLRFRGAPAGLAPFYLVANGAAIALAILAVLRSTFSAPLLYAFLELLTIAAASLMMIAIGRRHELPLRAVAQPALALIARFRGGVPA